MIRAALAALALAFALAHVGFLPSTLEDIDSVNFALGIRDFDVANHRPHPPGYPVYIAIGKIGVAIANLTGSRAARSAIEARSLAALSLVGAIVAIPLIYRVFRSLRVAPGRESGEAADEEPRWGQAEVRAVAATALAVACPLFWYMAIRPMSDMPGLAAALAAQAALALAWWRQQPDASGERRLAPARMEASGRMIVLGALLAAISMGFRSQNAVLTLPLLLGVLTDRIGRGVAGALVGATFAMAVGVLAWAIPLILASGGLDAYLAALGSQAGEDFAGGEMLYTNPSARLAAFALLRTFVHPWDSLVLGGIIATLAATGVISLALRDRRSLVLVGLLAIPYLIFHLLFQDTTFTRYALPLQLPVAFLAVRGLELAASRIALPGTAALALWGVAIASPTAAAYGREPSPTARVVAAMEAARGAAPPGALGMHQTFRRPLEAEAVDIEPRLPSPPRREWLEAARYWREGHTAPLWFLADPRRSDLALIDPRSLNDRLDAAWRFSSLASLGGMRPSAVTWYRMPPPGWFAEEGWALTPETAGIARLMGRGPSLGPITAWVRRRPDAIRMLVGGRHLGQPADPAVRFTVSIDGSPSSTWDVRAGFFLQQFDLAAGALAGEGPLARLTIAAAPADGAAIPTAIEQFDLQTVGSMMWAYDAGWHEAEYNPSLGVWRWTSDRSTLRIVDARGPVRVTFRVEDPRRYFDANPSVRLVAGSRVIGETNFASDVWSVLVPLDALQSAGGLLTIETSRTFSPAERGGPPDQRRLGLRVFAVSVAVEP